MKLGQRPLGKFPVLRFRFRRLYTLYIIICVGGRFTMTTGGGVFGFRMRISRATSRRRRVYKIRDTRVFFFTFPPNDFSTRRTFFVLSNMLRRLSTREITEKIKKKTDIFIVFTFFINYFNSYTYGIMIFYIRITCVFDRNLLEIS